MKRERERGRKGERERGFFSASQPSPQLPVGRRSGHSPGMWESQFQLAQQCACEGEFRASPLRFQGGSGPHLSCSSGALPCLFAVSPPISKNEYVCASLKKTKANQKPYWSGGPDLAAPTPARFPRVTSHAELGMAARPAAEPRRWVQTAAVKQHQEPGRLASHLWFLRCSPCSLWGCLQAGPDPFVIVL